MARRTSGTAGRALLTLAVAGMLVAPGVAGAVTWGTDKDVVITTADSPAALTDNTFAKSVSVDSGKLTVGSGTYMELRLTSISTDDVILTVKSGATLENNGGAILGINQTSPWAYYGIANIAGDTSLKAGGSISMKEINVTGGTHSITGATNVDIHPDKGDWRKNAQFYAGHNLTIAGDSAIAVNLGANGLLGAGSSNFPSGMLTIGKNATVTMQSAASAVDSAAVMHLAGDATLAIKDGGKLVVETSSVGAIGTKETVISGVGSELNVKGALEIITKLPDSTNANATANTTAGLLFTSGTLTVSNGGNVNLGTGTFTMSDGAVTADNMVLSDGETDSTKKYYLAPDVHALKGIHAGDFILTTGEANIKGDVYVAGQQLKVDGGTLNIGGDLYAKFGALSPSAGNINIAGTWTTRGTGATGLDLSSNSTSTMTLGALNLLKDTDSATPQLLFTGSSAYHDKLTFLGLGAGKDFITGDVAKTSTAGVVVTKGNFKLGDGTTATKGGKFDGITQMSGTDSGSGTTAADLTVDGGDWTLGTLNFTTAKANNFVTVESGKLTLNNITVGNAGTDGASANVAATGKLQVKFGDVYANSAATNLGVIKVEGGGELIVTGAGDANKQITLSEYAALIQEDNTAKGTALMTWDGTSLGTLTLEGTSIKFADSDKIDGNVDGSKLASGMNIGAENKVQYSATGNAVTAKGVTSGQLVVKGNATDVAVSIANGTLGLSANGGQFIVADSGAKTNVAVADNQTLSLNSAGTLNGNVTMSGAGSLLHVNAGAGSIVNVGEIAATDGIVGIQNSTLVAKKVTLAGGGDVAVMGNGILQTGDLTSASGGTLTIGNDDSAGSLLVTGTMALAGGQLFLDPAWNTSGTGSFSAASNATIASTAVDGLITVGQNSWVAMGTADSSAMVKAFANSGLSWGEESISAAFGVFKPVTIAASGSGLMVDGSIDEGNYNSGSGTIATANNVNLANNSLLIVDYAGLRDATSGAYGAAITAGSGSTVTIAQDTAAGAGDGAKLLLVNAQADKDVTVFTGFSNTTNDANIFTAENIHFNNFLLMADANSAWSATGGNLVVTPVFNTVAYDSLRNNGMGAGAGNIVTGYFGQNSVTNGFMETALSTMLYGNDSRQMAMNLEAGLDIARAADLRNAALGMVESSVGMVMNRSSFGYVANGISSGDSNVSFGLWGNPSYSHTETSAKISGSGFRVKADTDSFGGIIGADVTWNENLRVGAAFNVGGGDTKAKHDNISTKNSFSYVGGSLYGSYLYDRFAFSGVVGYTSFDNKVTQDMAHANAQLKAKPDSSVWNVGVEGKYTHTFSCGVNLVPSVGIEWLHFKQSSFSTAMNGVDQIHVGGVNSNIIRFPLRLAVNKDFALSNGVLTPEARVAFIPSTGNKMNSSVSLVNVPGAHGTLNGISPDNAAGEIGIGLTGKFSNLSLSAGYDFQFSQNQSNHRVNAMLRFEF